MKLTIVIIPLVLLSAVLLCKTINGENIENENVNSNDYVEKTEKKAFENEETTSAPKQKSENPNSANQITKSSEVS